MNLFYLDDDIEKSVQYHLDCHTNKIVVEAAQCLSTAWRLGHEKIEEIDWMYKASYINHPINLWLRESWGNMEWAAKYGIALRNEYIYRYNRPENLLLPLRIFEYTLEHVPNTMFWRDMTPFRCAVPSYCKISDKDPVLNYRKYYCIEKRHLFYKKDGTHRWTKREKPNWTLMWN